jgi:hypothetical protein
MGVPSGNPVSHGEAARLATSALRNLLSRALITQAKKNLKKFSGFKLGPQPRVKDERAATGF